MRPSRRSILPLILALWGPMGSVRADTFPTGPVRIVIGVGTGALDDVTRVLAREMERTLGVPVVVENRPGASGLVATNAIRQARADGQTILFAASTYVTNPLLLNSAKYDPVRDFMPISHIVMLPQVIVTAADSPIGSMQALAEHVKSSKEPLSYASTGVGTPSHVGFEMLKQRLGAEMTHVPFAGSNQALTEVIAGRVSFTSAPVAGLKGFVDSGRVKAIAVSGKQGRLPEFPQVPTLIESGYPEYAELGSWFCAVAPLNTPPAAISRLNAAINSALQSAALHEKLKAYGGSPIGGPPSVLADFLGRDVARWTRLIERAGLKKQ